METREDFMAKVNFVRPNRIKTKSSANFSIALCKKENSFNVYFRNSCRELFGEYVTFGIFKDRLIIEPAEIGTGFKITVPTKGYANDDVRVKYGVARMRVPAELFETYKEYVGDYELKRDDFYDYYYVQKKE